MFENFALSRYPGQIQALTGLPGAAGPALERTAQLPTLPPSRPGNCALSNDAPFPRQFKEIGSETSRERAAGHSLAEADYTGQSDRIQKLYTTDKFLRTTVRLDCIAGHHAEATSQPGSHFVASRANLKKPTRDRKK